MRIFNKITATVAAVMCLSGVGAFAAYTDVTQNDYCYESVTRLGDMGIISGYEDGSFNPGATITRAEFARIIVAAANKETEAKSTGFIASFDDVPGKLWSAPYINYVSANGIVSGYSDGSFRPEKTISFAECLTIMMRVLGYKEDTVGYFWPDNYVNAANSLGISNDMPYGVNQPVTRADVAMMLDRALFSEMNGLDNKILLEAAGYSVLKEVVVIDSGSANSKMSYNDIKLTDSKTYTSKMSFNALPGQYADCCVLDKNGYVIAMKVTGDGVNRAAVSKAVYVNGINGNTVNYISGGVTGSYSFDGNFTVYKSGDQGSFSQMKNSMTPGTDITFYGESDGVWSFAVISEEAVSPVIAKRNYSSADNNIEGITIIQNGLTVYRNGKAAAISDILVNDVVYYNTKTNVMDVYSKKVTGIYYDAQPSKAYVENVTVGGKSYAIGSDSAANKLNATAGSFEIGDRVTLLLGKDDKVEFALDLAGAVSENYGVVLSVGEETAQGGINEGSTEKYADIFMSDGESHRIVTDKEYKEAIGKLVRIDYQNSKAKLTAQNKPTRGWGILDKVNRTLDGKALTKDVVIYQRTSYEMEKSASCELLKIEIMTAKEIAASNMLAMVNANNFGDVAVLFVENVETTALFGMISGVTKNGEGGISGYRIYSDSNESVHQSNMNASGLAVGVPVKYELSGNNINKIYKLYQIKAGAMKAIDESRIRVGESVYALSPEVEIIKEGNSLSYSTIALDELSEMTNANVTVYSDTSAYDACVIRVIVVK